MIRPTDRWRAPSRGTPEQAIATFTRWGSFPIGQVGRFTHKLYDLCQIGGLDFSLLISHAALETGDAQRGLAFLDKAWATEDREDSTVNRYQPGGMGITDWEDLGYGNPDGEAAAYPFFGHHARYEIPANDPIWVHPEMQKAARADQRWDAVPKENVGTVRTVAVQTGRWWTNPNGHTDLCERGNQIFPGIPDQQATTGDKPVSTKMQKVRFVGLNKDVWLPDDITVKIDIVPASLTNIRSNQPFSGQTKTTWHDTGNPGSTPQSERNFLHGGAAGGYVGYNFAYGDKTIIQLTPLNEVTWAAGTPDGNRYSWHAEQCFGGSQDWDTTIATGAALHGGLCAAMGWDVDSALVPHQYWYGKWCPGQILNRGIWNSVVAKVKAAAARATAAAAGGEGKPEPTPGSLWPYPQPVPPTFWEQLQTVPYVLDGDTVWTRNTTMYRVKQSTKRQQFAVKDDRVVGPDLKVGETFRAAATGQSRTDHKMWVITPGLTRIDMDALDVVAEDHAAA